MAEKQQCLEARANRVSTCKLVADLEVDELEVAQQQLADAQQTISAQAAQIAELETSFRQIGERLQEYDQDPLEVAHDYINSLEAQVLPLANQVLVLRGELGWVRERNIALDVERIAAKEALAELAGAYLDLKAELGAAQQAIVERGARIAELDEALGIEKIVVTTYQRYGGYR